jgi:hypothetical protein
MFRCHFVPVVVRHVLLKKSNSQSSGSDSNIMIAGGKLPWHPEKKVIDSATRALIDRL